MEIKKEDYYNKSRIECIDYIESCTENLLGIESFLVGSIIKYLHRYKYKNGEIDLTKAKIYLDKLIEINKKGG